MGRYKENYSPESNFESKKPKPSSDGIIPRAPKWLNDNAKSIYKQSAREIVALGIAGKCDANILAVYALQMDRLMTLSEKKDKDLRTEKLLNELVASTLQLAKEIGLSPSARAKMRIAKVSEEDPTLALFEEEEETR